MNANRVIATTTAILTAGLAVSAFVLSFNSLTELAQQQGLSVPVLFPLILEGGLIVFSLTALTRLLQGQSAKVQWGLVIGSSLAAMTFNILHAPHQTTLSRVMWAIPSVMLLLSFESVLSQIRAGVVRSGLAADVKALNREIAQRRQDVTELDKTIGARSKQLDSLIARIMEQQSAETSANKPQFKPGDMEALDKANSTRQDNIAARRQVVLAKIKQGDTLQTIADDLEVSLSTIKADKRALNGQLREVQ